MEALDENTCEQLAKCLELLTTTHPKQDNNEHLNTVKRICKQSDNYVKRAYRILMHQLEKEHAEIRLFSLNVVDELFKRSHIFRTELLAEFQSFMELTIEIDPDYPLPPPKSIAKDLKLKACKLIQSWNDKYGNGYKQLQLGYRFLKDCKKVDFVDLEARSIAERTREEQISRQRIAVIKENVRQVLLILNDKQKEIENCITEFNNGFNLLQQSIDDIFTEEDFQNPQPCCSKSTNDTLAEELNAEQMAEIETIKDPEECEENTSLLRCHGLVSHKYNIPIEVDVKKKIEINKHNSAIVVILQNAVKLITKKYFPMVTKWIELFTKAGDQQEKLKIVINLKHALQTVMDKYKDLNLPVESIDGLESDDSDDDFIEVPEKEGYLDLNLTPSGIRVKSEDERDPTSLLANLKALSEKLAKGNTNINLAQPSKGNSSLKIKNIEKSKLLTNAPQVRYDVDLINWEEKLEPPTVTRFQGLHRFWQPQENETEEIKKPDQTNLLRQRKIDFSGDFKPVKWQCRALLPSGKLCPRYDRFKCPLHGIVIARDDSGNPTNIEDIKRLKEEQEKVDKAKPPDWQDPVLLKEIEAATGLDLTVGKKSRKKKKPDSELTDIKEKPTPRARLEKKILSKSAMKRVSSTLDNADYKRHRDKYGDQFNYFAN